MKIPPREEWLTPQEAAKKMGVSERSIRRARNRGKRSYSGEIIKLKFYKTLIGLVTTQVEIDLFHEKLNGG